MKTPVSPSLSVNVISLSTAWRSPAALLNALLATSTSSCTGTPPGQLDFKGLNQDGFDDEHDGPKAQRISKQERDIEELEGHADFETDAVRPPQQLRNQDDLPDQRKTGSRGSGDIGGELRQD